MRSYLNVLANRDYALLWSGSVVSQAGDSLSWVALTWLVYELTGSTQAMGWFLFFYTAPTVVGGLLAGALLDRFNRKRLMIADNLGRAAAIAAVPLLSYVGMLQTWHLYVAASVFGSLMMLSLAGAPAIVASLLPEKQLNTANALESIGWTLGDSLGRLAAGILIATVGTNLVLVLDVMTYVVFALCLGAMRWRGCSPTSVAHEPVALGLHEGIRFLCGNRLILATTLVFLVVNLGAGSLGIVLPVYADSALDAGARGFGLLAASVSAGQLIGSILVGTVRWHLPLGRSIALALVVAGAAFALLGLSTSLPAACGVLVLYGFVFAPVNVWAQTIRMRVIPEHLRGRAFGLLRTIIRSALPLSPALFAIAIAHLGIANSVLCVGCLVAVPGVLALVSDAFDETAPRAAVAGQ